MAMRVNTSVLPGTTPSTIHDMPGHPATPPRLQVESACPATVSPAHSRLCFLAAHAQSSASDTAPFVCCAMHHPAACSPSASVSYRESIDSWVNSPTHVDHTSHQEGSRPRASRSGSMVDIMDLPDTPPMPTDDIAGGSHDIDPATTALSSTCLAAAPWSSRLPRASPSLTCQRARASPLLRRPCIARAHSA